MIGLEMEQALLDTVECLLFYILYTQWLHMVGETAYIYDAWDA